MRLVIDNSSLIEAILIGFLRTLSANPESDYKSTFWASNTPFICPDGEIIRDVTTSPSNELKKAWLGLIEISEVYRLSPKASENEVTITPALTALAIAAYNFLKIYSQANHDKDVEIDKLSGLDYSVQLCKNIPPAANPDEVILYDSLIDPCCRFRRNNPPKKETDSTLLAALLRINPFSELKNLDLMLPAPLKKLAGNYLAHKEKNQEFVNQSEPAEADKSSNHIQKWWLQTEELILNPPIMRILRDQWLTIPENNLSCIGLGIFLEELRHRGKKDFRTPILAFFEAYDYVQHHRIQPKGDSEIYQRLTIIRHLLESKNREHNRKGNEYFLKFRALLEIIAEEQAIPKEFRHLSREFCFQQLAPLAALATVIGGEREADAPTFGEIQFSDQPEPV